MDWSARWDGVNDRGWSGDGRRLHGMGAVRGHCIIVTNLRHEARPPQLLCFSESPPGRCGTPLSAAGRVSRSPGAGPSVASSSSSQKKVTVGCASSPMHSESHRLLSGANWLFRRHLKARQGKARKVREKDLEISAWTWMVVVGADCPSPMVLVLIEKLSPPIRSSWTALGVPLKAPAIWWLLFVP